MEIQSRDIEILMINPVTGELLIFSPIFYGHHLEWSELPKEPFETTIRYSAKLKLTQVAWSIEGEKQSYRGKLSEYGHFVRVGSL